MFFCRIGCQRFANPRPSVPKRRSHIDRRWRWIGSEADDTFKFVRIHSISALDNESVAAIFSLVLVNSKIVFERREPVRQEQTLSTLSQRCIFKTPRFNVFQTSQTDSKRKNSIRISTQSNWHSLQAGLLAIPLKGFANTSTNTVWKTYCQ